MKPGLDVPGMPAPHSRFVGAASLVSPPTYRTLQYTSPNPVDVSIISRSSISQPIILSMTLDGSVLVVLTRNSPFTLPPSMISLPVASISAVMPPLPFNVPATFSEPSSVSVCPPAVTVTPCGIVAVTSLRTHMRFFSVIVAFGKSISAAI